MPFSPIPEVLDELRAGRMVILTDDEDRENEGDLILPAQFVTPEAITFMLSVARGYMCLSLTEADCDRLDLHPQAARNTSARGTPFTISIDGHPRHGFTTGVSARERARTIRMAIDPGTGPDDFVRPGHINPLRSRDGGVLVRTGQTEGSIDLCRLAGLYPAAVIIEIMRDDGEMARLPDLKALAERHGLRLCSVAQIIQHRLSAGHESLVKRLEPAAGTSLRTEFGTFNLIAYASVLDALPHIALTMGGIGELDPATGRGRIVDAPTLVRVHRRHMLGDIFYDLDSASDGPTGRTLHSAMRAIAAEGRGAIVYMRPEGRGDKPLTGSAALEQMLQTIRHHAAQAQDEETLRAETARDNHMPRAMRDFGIGGQILRDLGLKRLRLLTNHQTELPGLEAFGLEVVERAPLVGVSHQTI